METLIGPQAVHQRLRRIVPLAVALLFTLGELAVSAAEPAEGAAPPSRPRREGEPAGALTLDRAVALALERSPELAAVDSEIAAREGERVQAGLLPNPTAGLTVEDVAGSGAFRGVEEAETTLRLGQRLELGGKRGARVEAAARSRDVAALERNVRRAEVRADVSEKFFAVLALQHELDLRRESREIAEAALDIVRRRIVAGKASPLEEKKTRVALARSRVAEERTGRELRSARQRLVATWGGSTPAFTRAEGELFSRRALLPFEKLAAGLARSPEMELRTADLWQRSAEISLAKTGSVPDLTVEGGVRRLKGSDDNAVVAGLSLPLPIFDRHQGNVAAAKERLREAEERRRATEARLRAELFGLDQDLRRAAGELETLEREIITQAGEALELSREGFEAGRFSLLELLDAQRTFLEVREEEIRAATTYQTLVARIERLIGSEL